VYSDSESDWIEKGHHRAFAFALALTQLTTRTTLIHESVFFFFILHRFLVCAGFIHHQHLFYPPCHTPPILIIMNSSSPTPDIASLSLTSPPHQRLHDTYEFDGTGPGNVRPQYHFATSPHVPQTNQPPFNPLSMNQSPLKSKTARSGLPSVRFPFCFSVPIISIC
jgi:hypothetical protein